MILPKRIKIFLARDRVDDPERRRNPDCSPHGRTEEIKKTTLPNGDRVVRNKREAMANVTLRSEGRFSPIRLFKYSNLMIVIITPISMPRTSDPEKAYPANQEIVPISKNGRSSLSNWSAEEASTKLIKVSKRISNTAPMIRRVILLLVLWDLLENQRSKTSKIDCCNVHLYPDNKRM